MKASPRREGARLKGFPEKAAEGLLYASFFSSSAFFLAALSLQFMRAGASVLPLFYFFILGAALVLGWALVNLGKAASALAALLFLAFFYCSIASSYFPTVVLSALMFSLPFAWFGLVRGKRLSESFSALGFSRERALRAALLGVAATIFVLYPLILLESFALSALFGISDLGNVTDTILSAPWWVPALAVIVAPFSEEVFFRAFIVSGLFAASGRALSGFFGASAGRGVGGEAFAAGAALVLSALLFSLAHYSYGSVGEFVGAFTIGLIFGAMYLASGNIYAVIAGHAVFNLISVVVIFLGQSLPIQFLGLG